MTPPYPEAGTSVTAEMDRIRRSQMTHVADAEDLITYAKEIVALRTLIQPTPAETEVGELVGRLRARSQLNMAWDKWELGDKPVPPPLLHAETARHLSEAADAIESLSRHLEEAREALTDLLGCTHKPNPTDPTRIDIAPGKHRAFGDAIRRAKEAVSHG